MQVLFNYLFRLYEPHIIMGSPQAESILHASVQGIFRTQLSGEKVMCLLAPRRTKFVPFLQRTLYMPVDLLLSDTRVSDDDLVGVSCSF